MYTKPWIPRADEAFRSFAEDFCSNINAHPASFMMTAAEAASLMQALDRFQKAFKISSEPPTRTKPAIVDKDDARSILRDKIESYGAFIRVNRGIVDGDKLAIGVRPRNISHKKRTHPGTPPLLQYIGSLPGIDELRYHGSDTPTSKAKPRSAERLELWAAYATASNPKPKRDDARLIGSFKKSKMLVDHDPQRDVREGAIGEGAGMPVYWGRWIGYDSKPGPWSLAVSIAGARQKPAAGAAAFKPQTDAGDAAANLNLAA